MAAHRLVALAALAGALAAARPAWAEKPAAAGEAHGVIPLSGLVGSAAARAGGERPTAICIDQEIGRAHV